MRSVRPVENECVILLLAAVDHIGDDRPVAGRMGQPLGCPLVVVVPVHWGATPPQREGTVIQGERLADGCSQLDLVWVSPRDHGVPTAPNTFSAGFGGDGTAVVVNHATVSFRVVGSRRRSMAAS